MAAGRARRLGRPLSLRGAARQETLVALARAAVLLFGAASLSFDGLPVSHAAVAAHLLAAAVSLGVAAGVAAVRSGRVARRVGVVSTAVDLAAVAAYYAAFQGEAEASTLYVVFVALMGPWRWGLPGVLATGIPVGLIASAWPIPDASGDAPGGAELWALVALLTLPAAGVSAAARRSAARLRQAHEQFEAAFEHASIGMALLDDSRRVLEANRSLAALLGVPVEQVVGTVLDDWADPADRPALDAALRRLPASAHGIRVEVRFVASDGELRWGLVAASWLAGTSGVPPRMVTQVENVTERKSAEQRLSHLASHDPLTGLPNRSMLLAQLAGALRDERGVCVVFLDLDRFKVVNDGLGHAVGDRLLREVAARLLTQMRPGDVVARLGGDEFVLLCHGVHQEGEARSIAERVLAALRAPVAVEGGSDLVAGASAGIALSSPGCTAETLLRDADTAMYAAKGAGGGRARLFTPELHSAAVRTHELETDLRRALLAGRLDMAYHPIIDVATGRVTELEALVRWHDPERGSVPPGEFIPVAEQSSLIEELGLWVLDRALEDAAGWPAARTSEAPAVAVNVSARQLLDPGFPAAVARALDRHGVEPRRLCLEVTETALVEDTRELVVALHALRELGVRLAIDDFGTGHASLTYLAQLPVDVVKVDRSFVAGVVDDTGSAAIVGGVVAMAGAFALSVIAEGVEDAEQLHRLRRLGVDRAQGFLFSQPLDNAAVLTALTAPPSTGVPRPRAGDPHAREATPDDTAQRFRLLLEAARDVTACVDLHSVLEESFAALRSLVSFTGGSIQLVDGDVVRLAATDPPATPEAMAATLPVGTGISGGIAANGEPRYLPDITISAAVPSARRKRNTSLGVRSWYGVPLVAEGRVIGVLQVDSTEVDAFSEADRLLVLSFASVVASAVQGTRLFASELDVLQRPPA